MMDRAERFIRSLAPRLRPGLSLPVQEPVIFDFVECAATGRKFAGATT